METVETRKFYIKKDNVRRKIGYLGGDIAEIFDNPGLHIPHSRLIAYSVRYS